MAESSVSCHIAAYSCHQICAEVMCSPSLADPSKRVRLTVRLKQHLAAIQMQTNVYCCRQITVPHTVPKHTTLNVK